MSVKAVPEGFHTVTPQLSIDGAAGAIEFYKKAFGAEEVMRALDPSGKRIWHAVVKIGDSLVFVNDVFREMDPGAKQSSSSLWLYVPDVDALFARAVAAGATVKMPPGDMFWGDRMAHLADPFGQTWTLATHIKDLTPVQLKAAEEAFVAGMKKGG